jgi:tetratricopeptide (TPR) repeat protein
MTETFPFVGLRSFEPADAPWFFGRDQEISALAFKLQTANFTAVVGPSGSGKSSLVRAGAVPRLRAEGWTEIITKPGAAPMERLARALASADPDSRLLEARHFSFDTTLRASAFGLAKVIDNLEVEAQRIILLVDQFEELFRYGHDEAGIRRAGMREESRAFIELLLTAANSGTSRLHVCVTMRSDFFGACSSYLGLAEAVSASQFLVPLPVRGQLERAIRNPVEKANARIDEALVQRLLVDVEEEQDQLPLLQHTLRRLWERASGEPRTVRENDYIAIGRIDGSIDRKAKSLQDALARENAADLLTLERVMKALTDLDMRDRATRRPQKRSELLTLLKGPVFTDEAAAEASLDRVLKALTDEDTSFLQLDEGKDPEVDIVHEALIRSWTQLGGPQRDFGSGWLREERNDGLRWREYVNRAADGPLLRLRDRRNLSNWLRRRSLGREWSLRYGDRWDDVDALRRRSWQRGIAWAAGSAACFVLLFTYLAVDWYLWRGVTLGVTLRQEIDEADNSRIVAFRFASQQDYDRAIELLSNSLSVYDKAKDATRMVRAQVDRGRLYARAKKHDEAKRDMEHALETARQRASVGDEALALESLASVHEQFDEMDAAIPLYEQALEKYRAISDSFSIARVLEWKALQQETRGEFDRAASIYQDALEGYRGAGDALGTKRAYGAISRTSSWGFLVDLKRAKAFPMRGDKFTVGRNVDNIQNDLNLTNGCVSRRHLVINHDKFQADDVRSRNGTAVNADQIPYGLGIQLSDKDLISIANNEVLQFTTQRPTLPSMPTSTWAIFIDGSTKSYAYLTAPFYSIEFTSSDSPSAGLRIEEGDVRSAVLKIRRGPQVPELFDAVDKWSVRLFEKVNDYDYNVVYPRQGQWSDLSGRPARLVNLSSDRKKSLIEGPTFQIVTIIDRPECKLG